MTPTDSGRITREARVLVNSVIEIFIFIDVVVNQICFEVANGPQLAFLNQVVENTVACNTRLFVWLNFITCS